MMDILWAPKKNSPFPQGAGATEQVAPVQATTACSSPIEPPGLSVILSSTYRSIRRWRAPKFVDVSLFALIQLVELILIMLAPLLSKALVVQSVIICPCSLLQTVRLVPMVCISLCPCKLFLQFLHIWPQ